MSNIAIFGAGGKMGCRLIDNLRHSDHRLLCVEVNRGNIENICRRGLSVVAEDEALVEADVIILAIPDRLIGPVARQIAPRIRTGALVMLLDPAAPHAGELPSRPDIAYFVTHPCHPPVFNYDCTPEERRDFFGGIKAKQAIVCALMQGTEADYARGEEMARTMYAPVMRAHRVTVEQMAILEPAMAETVTACCITIIREAMDEAIRHGVPPEAARDFILGHINIPLAIVFGEINSPFSDGAKLIIEHGKQLLFKPDWKKVFEPESVRAQVQAIVRGTPAKA